MKIFDSKFEKRLKYIWENYHGYKRLEELQRCKGISEKNDKILKKFLRKHHRSLTKALLSTFKTGFHHNRKELFEGYTDTLTIMIKELFQNENVDWCDVEKIGEGSYSEVYKIGNKILKIGTPRQTYKIPNHSRILQPLIRINFVDDKNNNEPLICVEITSSAKKMRGLTLEKVYQIYKELRDDGIIWTDAREDNLGMLVEPNFPTLRGKRVNVGKNAVRIY